MIGTIFVIFIFIFSISKQCTIQVNGTHLHPGQPVLHYHLSRHITFDRKQFQDAWIYKNGFVTLGLPLEEDNYPTMADSSGIDQPFENMIGSNIIAVFIMANTMLSNSSVSAREIFVKSKYVNQGKYLIGFEKKIKEVYGKYLIAPLDYIVEIEWINVAPLGVDKGNENSFRLFLFNNKVQTFCIFQYTKIRSITYKISEKWLRYQSGLSSYSYMKYTLETYDPTDSNIPLEKSSNIGIKNTWLIMMGDSSYTMDIGWPSKYIDTNLMSPQRKSSLISSLNRKINSEFRTNMSTLKQVQTTNKFNFPINLKIESKKDQIKLLARRTSLKKISTFTNTQGYVSTRSVTDDHESNPNTNQISTNEEIIQKRTRIMYTKISKKSILRNITFRAYNISRNSPNEVSFDNQFHNSSHRLISTKAVTKIIKLDNVGKFYYNISANENSLKEKNQIQMKIYENKLIFLRNVTNKRYHQKRSSINKSSQNSVYKINTNNLKKPEMSIATSSSNPITPNGSLQTPMKPHLENNVCSNKSCNKNEVCFTSKYKVCCKCSNGAVYLDRRCIGYNDIFSINSKGIARVQSSMGIQWKLDLSLIIAKGTQSNQDVKRAYVTLISQSYLSSEFINFLLILYPLFHVPMSFYAFPWDNEAVPNLSALVDQVAGIHINVAVGSYKNIYISFKVERQDESHKWTISISGVDMEKVKNLNLQTRKFDEKSTGKHNLMYKLLNSNSIEYPEQTVVFYDEVSNTFLNITWRGMMTFSPTCLSDFIENKSYYIKFSDKRYCNSDCLTKIEVTKTTCRLMCLSSPHVFDTIPDPCRGNFCEGNRKCINLKHQYECRCLEGFHEIDDQCVKDNDSTTFPSTYTTAYNKSSGCLFCSQNADCEIIDEKQCCVCRTQYFGTGRLCLEKNSQFEINSFGTIKVIPYIFQPLLAQKINLRLRQWKSDSVINYATLVEIDSFPYSSEKEQQLLHSILLLSPLYDVPIIIFAMDHFLQTGFGNLYTMSRGKINIRIKIEGTIFPPVEITININDRHKSLDTVVTIIGISTINLDSQKLSEAKKHFSHRNIENVNYSVKDKMITFEKQKIKLPDSLNKYEMWWQGTGELGDCAKNVPENSYFIATGGQSRCNARCNRISCSPYCQADPILQVVSKEAKCSQVCHPKASCVKTKCVCRSGFSGNGMFCKAIRKTLECSNSKDCENKPYTECINRRCVCKIKSELGSTDCIKPDPCQSCQINEVCLQGRCVCKPTFVRNRSSQICVFDCSLCDLYSTKCINNGCICKPGFISKTVNRTSCQLRCSSNSDCPFREVCDSFNICICPYFKHNGVCQLQSQCDFCHRYATCQKNVCKCQENWIGDGINCSYNCSLCFSRDVCNSNTGCICPSGHEGNGNDCTVKQCYGQCLNGSKCQKIQDQYKCVCLPGFIMIGDKCSHDTVQLTILPPEPTTDVVELGDLDLFCLGSSQAISFALNWSRKSRKAIRGLQEFVDTTNKTLRLHIDSVKLEDSDRYICATSSGIQAWIDVTISKAIIQCENRCHAFAFCENGVCKCFEGYFGNSTSCLVAKKCSQNCLGNEVCDWKIGKCTCQPGFVKSIKGCLRDCRKDNICDNNARCQTSTGKCECVKEYFGNGTNCWKSDNCLLTKQCVANSTCRKIQEWNVDMCVCNSGFVGDGSVLCQPKIDCVSQLCGPGAFCEQITVKDLFGNLFHNAKCTCKKGYVPVDNVCKEQGKMQNMLWVSIGESLIRMELLGANKKSSIQHIDVTRNHDITGTITALTGSCELDQLVWSGQNGVNIRSARIGNFSNTVTHLSNLGKVTGISLDSDTANAFFTDSHTGRIGVVNINRNISRILLQIKDYSPGPISVHPVSGKLFWVVNDHRNPRIESAEMTGENRHVFIALENPAVSLIVAHDSNLRDRLCWIEVNELYRVRRLNVSSAFHVMAVLKCAVISDTHSPDIVNIHRIQNNEPFSGLAYFDQTFYWSVRSGKFINSWRKIESRLDINPNCCDSAIRGLIIISKYCTKNYARSNPCFQLTENKRCPQLCIPKINKERRIEGICLNANI